MTQSKKTVVRKTMRGVLCRRTQPRVAPVQSQKQSRNRAAVRRWATRMAKAKAKRHLRSLNAVKKPAILAGKPIGVQLREPS